MKRIGWWMLVLALSMLLIGCSNRQEDALEAGLTALEENRIDDARVCFKAALSSKGGRRYRRISGSASRYLGILYFDDGNYTEAENYLLRAATDSDEKEVVADVYAYLGEVYELTGRESEAIAAWSKSLDKKKDDVLSMKRLFLQWKTGAMSDQEAEGELSKHISKGDLTASYYLALIYEKGENYKKAVQIYEEAYEQKKDPELLVKIAECYHQMEDYEQMMAYYEKAEKDLSGEALAAVLWNEVSVFESHLDYANALAKAQKYLTIHPDNETMKKEEMFLRTRAAGGE